MSPNYPCAGQREPKKQSPLSAQFAGKQQAFLDFVLARYVAVGVEELEQEKLITLLLLKYHNSLSDALTDLGPPEEVGQMFASFQKYLYQQHAGM